VAEDSAYSFTPTAEDVEGDTLTFSIVNLPTWATFSTDTGTLSGTPTNDHVGTTEGIVITVSDGELFASLAAFDLTVTNVNDPPVATADSYSVDEDTPLTVAAPGVLGNDSDVDPTGDSLSSSLVTTVSSGSLTLYADGSFTYTPNADFNGEDSFSYEVSDGQSGTAQATVIITVTSINDAPVAGDDSKIVPENGSLNVTAPGILANDSDVDGDALSAAVVSGPAHAVSFTLNTDGSFIYTHDGSETNSDSFTYEVSDDNGGTAQATVSLTVTPINDGPVITGQSPLATPEETALPITLNDLEVTDPDSDYPDDFTLTVQDGDNYSRVDSTVTPALDYNGTITVPVTVDDGTTDIMVQWDANTEPTIVAYRLYYKEDTPGNHDLSSYDGSGLTFVGEPYDGQVVDSGFEINKADLPDPEASVISAQLSGFKENGIYYFVVTALDDTGLESSGSDEIGFSFFSASNTFDLSVQVTPVNDIPVVDDDGPYTIAEGETLTVSAASGLFSNDTDIDGDTLSPTVVSGPSYGSLTVNADGSFTYTHDGSETTADTFAYEANDGSGGTAQATVTLNITPVNDPPVANNDSYNVNEGETLTVEATAGLLANDGDAEGNSLAAILVSNVSHGTLTLNNDGSFTYIHDGSETTDDSFTYQAEDGLAGSIIATVSLTINPVNDAPTISGSPPITVAEDTLYSFSPTVEDVDGDTLTFSIVNLPTWATFSTDSGTLSGTPTNDHVGTTEGIVITVTDGELFSSLAAFDLTVTNVNDPPVATADSYSVDEDTPLTVAAPGVLGNDSDTDPTADILSAGLVSDVSSGSLSLNADGSFTYTPSADFDGEDSFTYEVSDGQGGTAQATVSISINAINDVPVITGQHSPATPKNVALTITLDDLIVFDPDNTYPDNFVLSVHDGIDYSRNGNTITPALDYVGTLAVPVTVNDGTAQSTVFELSVEVLSDNDGDGIADVDDVDDDNDGMPDSWEEEYGLDPLQDDAAVDLDRDNLSNEQEYLNGTDPWATDTDGDTIGDGTEVQMGTGPLDPESAPDISLSTAHLWITDVTPTSSSVVWTSKQPAAGFVNIYADPEGTDLIRDLTIVDDSANHPPAGDSGVMKVDVFGLDPNTAYYVRIVTISNEAVLVQPAQGESLPSVQTEDSSEYVTNDVLAHQVLQSDQTTPALGALLLAKVEGATYPVSGWVGEGVSDPSFALADLNNIYSQATHVNLELSGGEAVTLVSIGGSMGYRRLNGEIPAETGGTTTLDPTPDTDQCTLDLVSPVIDAEQLTPAQGAFTNDTTPLIAAAYSDQYSEIDPDSVSMQVDGVDVTEQITADSSQVEYTPTAPLAEGSHTVTVIVADEWSNEADPFTWTFTVELTPPVVTILEPENGDSLYPAHQTIKWQIVEDNLETVTLSVNGSSETLPPGVFEHTVELESDLNESDLNVIEIAALDKAGNSGSATVQVILDEDPDGDGIGNHYDDDDDNDLVPDIWEDSYGLDPLDPFDIYRDSDGDGYADITEYTGGESNPLDPNDFPNHNLSVDYLTTTDVTTDGFSVVR
jgi:VCBS repeat-containing protein